MIQDRDISMSLKRTLLVAALLCALGFPALADRLQMLTPAQQTSIEAAVKAELPHPEKAIFLPLRFGYQSIEEEHVIWVCGSVKATDSDGTYLADQSEFLGRLDETSSTFTVDHFALSSVTDRTAVLETCATLAKSAS